MELFHDKFYKTDKLKLSVFIIILFHISGFIGLNTEYKHWFLNNTPLNLLVSSFLLLWNHNKLNSKIVLTVLFVIITGLLIEITGVKTGLVFGIYHYGKTFGLQISDVPVVIGLNWAMLCFSSSVIADKYINGLFKKAFIAGIIPLCIDFFIEHVCEKLDFWYWDKSIIPVQNFVSWFIFSFCFALIIIPALKNTENKFAPYFLSVQFVFFLLLNIFGTHI